MAHADFNRELTSYLKDRTKKSHIGEGYLKKKKIKEPAEHEMPQMRDNEVVVIKGEKTILQKILDKIHHMAKRDQKKIQVEEETIPQEQIYQDSEFEKEEKLYEQELEKTKDGFWARLLSIFVPENKVTEEEALEEQSAQEKEQFKKELREMEKEEEKLDKAEMRIKEKKLGLIFNLLSKFRFAGKSAEEEIVKEEAREFDLYQDLKEVAKITTSLMKKIPPEEVGAMKRSPEFVRFKEILKKHGLIREEPKQVVETTEIKQEPVQVETSEAEASSPVEVVDMPKEEPKPAAEAKEEINIYRLDELNKR